MFDVSHLMKDFSDESFMKIAKLISYAQNFKTD